MKLVVHAAEGEQFFDLIDTAQGVDWVRTTTNDDLLREIADAEVFFGFPTSALMAAAKQLRWIQTPSAGVNFLMKVPELVESDVVLTNTRGAHAPSISEHVFALLLALTRAIPTCVKWQQERYWARDEAYRIPREIMGGTMGIIGYGQIGRMVAKRAAGFDMSALAVDVMAGAGDERVAEVWGIERLHEMLAASDVVVVAAPYTKESHHLLGATAFEAMKPESYLIAISRGGIIDELALVASLQAGRLSGAGLDVAEIEPLPDDSPLWDAPNILLSPHLAGSSWQKEKRCVEILVENLGRYQRGEELLNICDKQAGY